MGAGGWAASDGREPLVPLVGAQQHQALSTVLSKCALAATCSKICTKPGALPSGAGHPAKGLASPCDTSLVGSE